MSEDREGLEEGMQSGPSGVPEAKGKPPRKRWDAKTRLLALCAVVAVGWVVIWGPIGLGVKPSNPKFCIWWCHNMQPQYDAWRVSVHNSQICAECHLPEEPVSALFWDAMFGARDIWKFNIVGEWDEPIYASERTRTFAQENCIRCHGTTAHAAISEDRYCWDCHREIYHRGQAWAVEQAQRRTDDSRN